MIIPLSWLKDFISIDPTTDPEHISKTLTNIGLEVENVNHTSNALKNFLICRVLETYPHPNASKLHICTVDIGKQDPVQVICGAKNVKAGLKSIFAPIGTTIPASDIIISQASIRGISSYGMLCSASELKIETDTISNADTDNNSIVELTEQEEIGMALTDYHELDDTIFDVSVTVNRGDCLSMLGIARELSASGIGELKPVSFPSIDIRNTPVHSLDVQAPDKCQFFSIHYIQNIQKKTTPIYIRQRLSKIGVKRVNAAVDLVNYVVHAFGHPMHVYDADKIGKKLSVKTRAGKIDALDGMQYEVTSSDISVISDEQIISLAGIIGSEDSKVTENTTNIILESGIFDPIRVSQTGNRLNLHTEARHRFERQVDTEMPLKAASVVASQISLICEGEIHSQVQVSSNVEKNICISARSLSADIKKIANISIKDKEVNLILRSLGYHLTKTSNETLITAPSWRHDVLCDRDVIADVIRIKGLQHIPVLHIPQNNIQHDTSELSIKKFLTSLGYNETISWSFISKEEAFQFCSNEKELVQVENPISDNLSYMRQSIVQSLLKVVEKNLERDAEQVSLFEIAPIFPNLEEEVTVISLMKCGLLTDSNPHIPDKNVDFFDVKGDLEALLKTMNIDLDTITWCTKECPQFLHPNRSANIMADEVKIGHIGELHPFLTQNIKVRVISSEIAMQKINKITSSKKYFVPSNYQQTIRDLAFTTALNNNLGAIPKAIKNINPLLITDVKIFDIFSGPPLEEGKKSFAIRIYLLPQDKTLDEQLIATIMSNVIDTLKKKFSSHLRS
ncbi:phenylalanine--tRNA ligase subunit beta [Candidatus Sneabacter namystus]|uniref:Phenylalanine--tRNA ligase beta subunit n=1 Tax=Candidatus Sneabacter namystus TaxID=2601646 RepID=A0A5C0UI60_9RICK|nr:phenylalanine--tRNA ligase subunit beta [Candidatus Sneabacter namystus]QEK39457.1 phenylalanine--tRNA ligase subunit beta [Candidatus Sneabacter namystus]